MYAYCSVYGKMLERVTQAHDSKGFHSNFITAAGERERERDRRVCTIENGNSDGSVCNSAVADVLSFAAVT